MIENRSLYELLIHDLREVSNQLDGKPYSCMVTREDDAPQNTSFVIRTTFEPLDDGKIPLIVTEVKLSYLRRVLPGD